MAKKSVVNRNNDRIKMVAKFAAKYKKLKSIIKDPDVSDDERRAAQIKLQKLPRDASPIRVRRRCELTGRSRGVYRKFKLSRMKLREHVKRGDIPGITKASW